MAARGTRGKQLPSSAGLAPTKDPWEDSEKQHWEQRAPFQKLCPTGSFQHKAQAMFSWSQWAPVPTCTPLKFSTNQGLTTNGGTFGHLHPLWEEDITKVHAVISFPSSLTPFLLFSLLFQLFMLIFVFLLPPNSLFPCLSVPTSISLCPLFYSPPPACPILTSRSCFSWSFQFIFLFQQRRPVSLSHSFSSPFPYFSRSLYLFLLFFSLRTPFISLFLPLCSYLHFSVPFNSTPLLQHVLFSQVGPVFPRFFNSYFCSNREGWAFAEPTLPWALSQPGSLAEGEQGHRAPRALPLGSVPVRSCQIHSLVASPRGLTLSGGVFITNMAFLGAWGYFVWVHSRQIWAG